MKVAVKRVSFVLFFCCSFPSPPIQSGRVENKMMEKKNDDDDDDEKPQPRGCSESVK